MSDDRKLDAVRVFTFLIILFDVPILGAWIGGYFYLAKTGKIPEGVFWTELPVIGSGMIPVLALSVMGVNFLTRHDLSFQVKRVIGVIWLIGFVALVVNVPLYMVSTNQDSTITESITWVLEDKHENLLTYLSYMLSVSLVLLTLTGVLVSSRQSSPVFQAGVVAAIDTMSLPRDDDRSEKASPASVENSIVDKQVLDSVGILGSATALQVQEILPHILLPEIRRSLQRLDAQNTIVHVQIVAGEKSYGRI